MLEERGREWDSLKDLNLHEDDFRAFAYEDRLINKLAGELQSQGAVEARQKYALQKLPSGKSAEQGVLVGQTDPGAQMEVTVEMKSRASEAEMDRVLKEIRDGKRAPLTDEEYDKEFGSSQACLNSVSKFARDNGLTIEKANLNSGQVILKGTAGQFSRAFQTEINDYDDGGSLVHGRATDLKIPKSLARSIEGVFGLDGSPVAKSHTVKFEPEADSGPFSPHAGDGSSSDGSSSQPKSPISYLPNEVADAYHFPEGTTGKGQGVAIIELGGGIDMKNEAEYYKEHGLKMPDIKVVEIDGSKNRINTNGDDEVALDSQIVGAVAPDARQMIIFAPNGHGDKGFIDAVTRATFTEAGETRNTAISISWGKPIDAWSEDSKHAMNLALKKAALKGISVFVASGDDGAVDGSSTGLPTVDYPAADPYATATGGTRLVASNGKIDSEVTWNDRYGGSGGGISPDEVPDYQKGLPMPAGAHSGRGVPDIAGDADPYTGYKIRVHGHDQVNGGTSAVAPLYAALAVRLNEGLGGQRTVGFMNPFLYRSGLSGHAPFFNDVSAGNNNGYEAGKGWDPVTGWGSVNGELLLKALKEQLDPPGSRLV